MRGVVAFDLEISKEIPDGVSDWRSCAPLGISCAATLRSDGDLRLWHGAEQADGMRAPQMSPAEVAQLVAYLKDQVQQHGQLLLSFNGLGFDFPVLVDELRSPDGLAECSALAYYDHIDIGFQMVCQRGFMISLQTASQALGLPGKTDGMRGDLAPTMWARSREDQDTVLEYVAQDVRATLDLYNAIVTHGVVRWIARSGNAAMWIPRFCMDGTDRRLLTVQECLAISEVTVAPGSAFQPWPRSKFAGWLQF